MPDDPDLSELEGLDDDELSYLEELAKGGGNDNGGAAGAGADGGSGLAAQVADLATTVAGLVTGKGADDTTPPASSSSSTPPADVEGQVRAAMSKVGKETDTDERLKKVEQVLERPPLKQGKLSRLLWGKVDA